MKWQNKSHGQVGHGNKDKPTEKKRIRERVSHATAKKMSGREREGGR